MGDLSFPLGLLGGNGGSGPPGSGVTSVNGDPGPAVILGKASVGLGNADNTSDMDKPVSTAQAAADTAVANAAAADATSKANAAYNAARDRSNQIGTQLASTISDFDAAARGQVVAQLVDGVGISFTVTGTGATQTLAINWDGIPDGDYGDGTFSGGGTAFTINPGVVDNSKLGNMPFATFKGRASAGSGPPQDLTPAQVTAGLNVFTNTLKGLAPSSGGGTTNFLRADGNWAAPPGGSGGYNYYDLVAQGGLVGDGVTENSTAFIAAVTAAAGNYMYLPPGDFVLNKVVIQLGPSIPAFRLICAGNFLYQGERIGVVDGQCIEIRGEWGPEITPVSIVAVDNTQTLDPGGTTIVLPSLTGWNTNDVLKIYCDARYPFIDTSGNATPFVAEQARVVKTDPASTAICLPRLFSGPTFVAQLAGGICRLRKMIHRPVEIIDAKFVTTIDPSMDPPSPNNYPRSPALVLQGLVRAQVKADMTRCAGRGVDEQSCHESDIEVRALEVFNGSASSRNRKVFGYTIDVHYSSSRGRYRFLANTGRHTCTTDFDDSGVAFDLANYVTFGGSFYPTFYDSEAHNATGTPFDTHEFCFFPLWENCRVNGSVTYNGASGSNGFSHRAFSPTYSNCHAVDVKSGFDDSSAAYTYENLNAPNKGIARYVNCTVKMLSTPSLAAGVGLLLGGHPGPTPPAVNSTAQGVEVYNFRSSGGASGIEIRNVSTLKLRGISLGEYSIAGLRFNTNYASTITNFVDMQDVEFYHTSTSSTSSAIRMTSANVRANILMKDVIIKAPTTLSRPTLGIIEIATTPTALTVEERGNVKCEYKQLYLVSGTLPAGAVVKTTTLGAGPTTAYGTVPDQGDLSVTVNNAQTPATLVWNTPLTANRAITLDTLNLPNKGQQFRFIRTKNATGAFVLDVLGNSATGFNTITLTAGGPGVTVEFDGALWQQVG